MRNSGAGMRDSGQSFNLNKAEETDGFNLNLRLENTAALVGLQEARTVSTKHLNNED
jgi:hypothetical protein